MISFIIGFFIGGFVGIFGMALLAISKDADERSEEAMRKENTK